MEQLIAEIKKKKIDCYFVSPHLDDAILSAGGLLSYLQKYTRVTVINVFTKGSAGRNTLSSKVALMRMGFPNAQTYFSKRREEDRNVMKKINVNVVDLGFVDALWRNKRKIGNLEKIAGKMLPEVLRIYPTYKFHIASGRVSPQDSSLELALLKKLSHIKKGAIIFCPRGIGGHVDHVLVSNVCSQISGKKVYWSDFPYSQKSNPAANKQKRVVVKKGLSEKKDLINMYKTQVKRMFPNGLGPIKEEVYFI